MHQQLFENHLYADDIPLQVRESHYERTTALTNMFLEEVRDSDSARWGFIALRFLIKAKQTNDPYWNYYGDRIQYVVQNLLSTTPAESSVIYQRTEEAAHTIDALFPERKHSVEKITNLQFLSFEELIHRHPENFSMTTALVQGHTMPAMAIRYHGLEQIVMLPTSAGVAHKGGFPRILGKIANNGLPQTIEAEIPVNDIDTLILASFMGAKEEALAMGADQSGIEVIHANEFDEQTIHAIFSSRDVFINACLVTNKGLWFSSEAAQAFQTGRNQIIGRPGGVYGPEFLFYSDEKVKDLLLYNQKGLYRFARFLITGKSESFIESELNLQIEMTRHWLIMANQFSQKPKFNYYFQRMFALARQLQPHSFPEHVQPDDVNEFFNFLERIHAQNIDFDLASKYDERDHAEWYLYKLMASIRRHCRFEYEIPLSLKLTPTADYKEIEISLNNFEPFPISDEILKQAWEAFLAGCRKRTDKYYLLHPKRKRY